MQLKFLEFKIIFVEIKNDNEFRRIFKSTSSKSGTNYI